MTDLWVHLLVLCQVPELSRTCILTKAIYHRLCRADNRGKFKECFKGVLCNVLISLQMQEWWNIYKKNFVVLFSQILMIIGGNTCWSSVWIKKIFKIGFYSVDKSKLINGQRFWIQKTKQNLFKGANFSFTIETLWLNQKHGNMEW